MIKKTYKNKRTVFNLIYFIQVIIILFICIIIFNTCRTTYTKTRILDPLISFNSGWYNDTEKNVTLDKFTSKNGYSTKKYTTYKHKIDYSITSGTTLCFRSLSTDVKIYINNKLVLDTPYKESPFSCKSSGSVWNFYEFKQSDIGKEMTIKIKPFYNDNSCYITDMYVGNASHYVYNIFMENSLFFILCILLMIIGVIFIAADLFINKVQDISSHELIYIGIFSCVLGIWCSTSTHILEFVFNNSQLIQTLACNMLYLISLPALFFLDNIFKFKKKKYINFSAYIIIGSYILAWILQLLNIADFHETLILSHINMIISFLIIVSLLFKSFKDKDFNSSNESRISKAIRNTIFITTILCVFTDMILFIKGTTTPGFLVSCDLILIIVYLSCLSVINLFKAAKSADHAKFVKELAYKDGLTNIGNRTAYKEKIAYIKEHINSYKAIGIVIFDVNNLKMVNDTYGHLQGDQMIIDAANIISQSFETFSTPYRIGGDEFAVIIEAPNAEAVCKISLMQFNVNIHNHNIFYSKDYDISIAHGEEFYKAGQNITIDEIIKKADMNMYKMKKDMKKGIKKD